MRQVVRSAMLQMRVTPAIKMGSERVLRHLGLTMTEAVELFLRRMIVDQRIPFDVVALDAATLGQLEDEWCEEQRIWQRHDPRAQGKSKARVRA
jgi:addiction module RelB/DinJ family antitoxin